LDVGPGSKRLVMPGLRSLTFDRFAAALFFIAVGFTACLMPAQNDTWWHLRAGQVIVETHAIPLADSFSHTVNGSYWPDHEWLSQVVFYLMYKVGGLPLLTGFAAAVVTLAWFIVWRLTPGRPLVRIGLSVLALGSTAGEWAIRPQIFTLLLLAITAHCLVQRRYIFLPLVFLIWANLHGGVTLGVVLLSAAAAVHIASTRRILSQPVVCIGLAALMTLLTPLGWSLWTDMPSALARSRSYGIHEWRALDVRDPALLPFWILSAVFLVLCLRKQPWRRVSDEDVLAWGSVVMFPLALSLSRNVPALEVAMVPAVGMLLNGESISERSASTRVERPALNASLVSAALAAAVLGVGYAWNQSIPRLGWQPMSSGAIAAVTDCPGPVYNRYDDGGFLIWFAPQVKVFIDSRQDPYPPALVREHIAVEESGQYQGLFDRYSIRCAIGPSNSLVAQHLKTDGWRELYADSTWAVLTRNP
jgi:hypothetical protein